MKRTGLSFSVEGEYVTEGDYKVRTDEGGFMDPSDQNWIPFSNADIHPFGKPTFTAWSQFSDLNKQDIQELTDQVVQVIDWLRQERDWALFDATLWLHRGKDDDPLRVFRWELC